MVMFGPEKELKLGDIACNEPRACTTVATVAADFEIGDEALMHRLCASDIMADATCAIATRPAHECSSCFLIESKVRAVEVFTNFDCYCHEPSGLSQCNPLTMPEPSCRRA